MDRRHVIEAEMELAIGRVRVVRSSWAEPIDNDAVSSNHHLQLSLMPQPGAVEAGFPERWTRHRYEPMGELFFLPAGERVRARSHCRDQNAVVLTLYPDAVAQWIDAAGPWSDPRLKAMLDIPSSSLRRMMFRIGEETRNPGFAGSAIVESLSRLVTIELARHLLGIGEPHCKGGLVAWRLRLIDERLARDDIPSLTELADLCGLSSRHLTRAFRISRGRSIGGYIAERRIDMAKHMLAAGESVKAAAFATGFTAPSNFAVAFRRATGESPRAYRGRAARVASDA